MHTLNLEILRPLPQGSHPRYAVLDFDGTVSLIREGWQDIMIPYFTDELAVTPQGAQLPRSELAELARDFVFVNTGKQTIYQCIELANQITRLGGTPQDPQVYKDEYVRRLLEAIDQRLEGLRGGSIPREELLVPGSVELLEMLRRHGVQLYLASGTDDPHVKIEAALLGLDQYFDGHIYGAQRDYKTFSKKMVIDRIIQENNLSGTELLGFGDGYVEIENIRSVGGYACGVASNEKTRQGIDEWKRERLTGVGADIIIPDYRCVEELEAYLFQYE